MKNAVVKKGLSNVRREMEMEINKEIMFNFTKQDNKIVQVVYGVTQKGLQF